MTAALLGDDEEADQHHDRGEYQRREPGEQQLQGLTGLVCRRLGVQVLRWWPAEEAARSAMSGARVRHVFTLGVHGDR
ncbi:hypothetical protein GCM10010435_55310 [Winogradskya consettensis]|uniref:Uncharacterized protein n=1 Tax=Winogradskya consettensis TaxID=113560 RepID=A0A919SBS2_9ACTN|nr:hypothetical protein Aco04nite_07010 [Actinoplanes consettensis]